MGNQMLRANCKGFSGFFISFIKNNCKISSDSFDHLILLPISPLLQPGRIATEISAIHKRIRAQTNPVQIDEDEELEPEGEPIPEYVPRNAPQNKFSLLVVDQLHSSECFVQVFLIKFL
jgi:hypothetical protein